MPTYTDSKILYGDQGALDALVSGSLSVLADKDVTTLRKYALYNNRALEEICFPKLASISSNALYGCSNLKKAIIGTNLQTVCTANSSAGLSDTGHCIFFVPDSLVDSYKAANPWINISERIMGVSHADEIFWDDSEIADSWTEIINNVTNGAAASRYHVGQYKTIDLYTEGIITFRIAGINTDELASGSGTAQLTWIADHVLSTQIYYDNVGSYTRWKDSVVRAALESDVLPLFPEVIRNAIKPVKKYSRAYTSGSDAISDDLTTDKLWIPGAREVYMGMSSLPRETLGPRYFIPFAQMSFIGRKFLNGNSAYMYLRTAYNSANIISFSDSGSQSSASKSSSLSFAIGFCT